ncbi:MAE_28990/MAE_18760 family HEPN-like nuclease [Pseudomonas sp. 1 R 17]|jgi:hypothetical protein|uniref:MAE_28990/MAE_18760 family HEPN-like nuclease n=1 Tax=Pseudomonas sp. 1 R 17 TaxID=1844091 RepID=UPI0008121DB6|nr:MAE_28990/MAE_18760 family HEPN-like nuclease [Pseudomonas sp. 1 R 17]SAM36028.1 hypothetical protein BN1864_LIB5394:06075 [Pseudomonas sp. 1 R 17]
MDDLLAAFEERLSEVETYIDFLKLMEGVAQQGPPKFEGAGHPISAQQQKILYSSVYLQLYNLVESTMTLCIDFVASATTNSATWGPQHLSEQLLREWIRLTARTHKDLTPEHRLDYALKLCAQLISQEPIAEFSIEKGGGGNWDDNEIEAITKRIGFKLKVKKKIYDDVKRPFRDELGPLALVKRLRNRLAHGSISFTECAEYETVTRLADLKDKTVCYLREVIVCFCAYVEKHEFLVPERRPV